MASLTIAIASAILLGLAQAQRPLVDLGYAKYVGVTNNTTNLNIWKGIRYAAAPTGEFRFAAPHEPPVTGQTFAADKDGPSCYQTSPAPGTGGSPFPTAQLSEDCLLLNVFAPTNTTTKLPVLVTIHGGGYGLGNASLADPTTILTTSGNQPFIGVSIQYRLGAFGFLSSEDVKEVGALNAGLLDQQFALQWVQKYIHLFGGDRSQVTITGESAGGGSVMLQTLAYGGSQGQSLFRYAVAQSPYVPKQFRYDEEFPTAQYNKFIEAVGCSDVSKNKLPCVRSKPVDLLVAASNNVSSSGIHATWAFVPVTDGCLIKHAPTQQLLGNYSINGERLWVGSSADEGADFVRQNISTIEHVRDYVRTYLSRFTETDIDELLSIYPQTAYAADPNSPLFATSGESAPSALNVSPIAIGPQQTANLIYAELTIICPAYYMASSYSRQHRTAYKYQYSVPAAFHGTALNAYYGPQTPNQGDDFVFAWRRMYGAFISTGIPNVSAEIGNGISTGNNTVPSPLSYWPAWTTQDAKQMNFNQTGGVPYSAQSATNPSLGNFTQNRNPGLRNDFRVVDALDWESGRGKRCEFWREKASKVPF